MEILRNVAANLGEIGVKSAKFRRKRPFASVDMPHLRTLESTWRPNRVGTQGVFQRNYRRNLRICQLDSEGQTREETRALASGLMERGEGFVRRVIVLCLLVGMLVPTAAFAQEEDEHVLPMDPADLATSEGQMLQQGLQYSDQENYLAASLIFYRLFA